MFLKNLTIKTTSWELIRSIDFKRWVNLILNYGTTDSSWNSVGKTTLLRAIDFCLWSDWRDFYTDPETKELDEVIVSFLENKNPIFTLTFDDKNHKEILVIKRSHQWDVLEINGDKKSSLSDYNSSLLGLFFLSSWKPSFRDIIPKFIRKNIRRMTNILKLFNEFVTKDKFWSIIAILFLFQNTWIISERLLIKENLRKQAKKKTAIWAKSPKQLLQKIALLEEQILELENQRENLNVINSSDYNINELWEIKSKLTLLRTSIGVIDIKINAFQRAINVLQNETVTVDNSWIKELYQQAKVYISDLNKDFSDLVQFHNQTILNKIKFIQKNLAWVEIERWKVKDEIFFLEKQESLLLWKVSNKNLLWDLFQLQDQISEKHRQKWMLDQELKQILDIDTIIDWLKKSELLLDERFKEYEDDFARKILTFNIYFAEYTKKLYKTESMLEIDESFQPSISNISQNPWLGEKKSHIAAFDFAYMKFLSSYDCNFPRFTLHDSPEDTSSVFLSTLFEIANTLDWQYIVSVLKERIEYLWDTFIKSNRILELNENDKFFRVEYFAEIDYKWL